jgi:SNF2 family DNA or RNA helicase
MRLTQDKAVTVTRYITKGTIEEARFLQAVRDRQSKKLELAELTLNRDMGSEDQIRKRFYVSLSACKANLY